MSTSISLYILIGCTSALVIMALVIGLIEIFKGR